MIDDEFDLAPTPRLTSHVIQSATAAYRADAGTDGKAIGPGDGDWLVIASVLSHACIAPRAERDSLVRDAVAAARAVLREHETREATSSEWGSATDASAAEIILMLADVMYESGALHLTRVVLDGFLEADSSLGILDRGHLLARRARVDGRLGRLEEAADQYRTVSRLGKQIDSAELRIRAWIGHGALAQMRGNYPEQQSYSRRAARLADRLGLKPLSRLAHSGLMITAGARHDFDEALRHARIVYRASLGDPIPEAEILQNIGQLLLEARHTELAADVFANVLSRPLPARVILPALGGFALASGLRGDLKEVCWVQSELERFDLTAGAPPHPYASALLECAAALSNCGQAAEAERLLERAVRVAEAHGYYEIVVKADELRRTQPVTPPVVPKPTPMVQRLASELERGSADRRPRHVLVSSGAL